MCGLQARFPVGGTQEATTHGCFSPALSPSLSLKINKFLKKKRKRKYTVGIKSQLDTEDKKIAELENVKK